LACGTALARIARRSFVASVASLAAVVTEDPRDQRCLFRGQTRGGRGVCTSQTRRWKSRQLAVKWNIQAPLELVRQSLRRLGHGRSDPDL
jgi:hypothetical protein